ncbi:hypothetical protein [Mesorhizobium sp.]|uniref:hypothetical protein n=1 Tax=Mesorhizobium sp. TaxID=1871066 RepID=UPI0025C15683|nr:hypothetical protein [Mesorhizobium sp.]
MGFSRQKIGFEKFTRHFLNAVTAARLAGRAVKKPAAIAHSRSEERFGLRISSS